MLPLDSSAKLWGVFNMIWLIKANGEDASSATGRQAVIGCSASCVYFVLMVLIFIWRSAVLPQLPSSKGLCANTAGIDAPQMSIFPAVVKKRHMS